MPEYRRAFQPGGTFFFTVVTHHRRRFLCTPLARRLLRESLKQTQREMAFEINAMVLLPDHLHSIWVLSDDDHDFSTRWGKIKKRFTDAWCQAGGAEAAITESRARRHERGVWQPRFWEHTIRDETDWCRHLDYIHYNPVKHELASCPHGWPYSTFRKWVRLKAYAWDWQCACRSSPTPPDFTSLDATAME